MKKKMSKRSKNNKTYKKMSKKSKYIQEDALLYATQYLFYQCRYYTKFERLFIETMKFTLIDLILDSFWTLANDNPQTKLTLFKREIPEELLCRFAIFAPWIN